VQGVLSALRELTGCPRAEHAAATLALVRDELRALDDRPCGSDTAVYGRVAAALDALPVTAETTGLFQADLMKPAVSATLGREVTDEISRGVELLRRVSGRRAPDHLGPFRDAFRERYGRREVPVCEALDREAGIGFPAAPRASEPPDRARDTLLLRWLSAALRSGADEIALGAQEVAALTATDEAPPPPLPDAFSVMATVLAGSEGDVSRGRFRVLLSGVGGPSGATLLGRFCHGQAALRDHVLAHLRAEEDLRPEAVFAEVVHLPEGRVGNVLARPRLRAYEIPYLGRSTAPPDHRIAVRDLLVSVVGDRVVLRSAALGREVQPRLTTAHDFRGSGNVELYRFLCAVQAQRVATGLSFSYGGLAGAPFLPRVTAGRLVLSRARWNLTGRQLVVLRGLRDRRLFTAVQRLRESLRLPRWVAVEDGDNRLPVDLESVLSVEMFAGLLGRRPRATLTELFHGPDDVIASGPEGRFVHELVLPFVRSSVTPAADLPSPPSPSRARRPVRRSFPPGSEWLYAKLYTGAAGADAVLKGVVRPLVRRCLADGSVDSWHFVRYGDPDWHLRVRLHGEPDRLLREVLPALHEAVVRPELAGCVRRLQIDTYEREVERYGGAAGIVLAERLFYADSEAALTLVGAVPPEDRWRLALQGCDQLLTDFGLDPAAKRAVVGAARHHLREELRPDAELRHGLGVRFRTEREALEGMLRSGPAPAFGPDVEAALVTRSVATRSAVAELRGEDRAGALGRPLDFLAGTLLHMHANRLLRSAARTQELLLHDFLCRLYDSSAFLSRGAGSPRPSPARRAE
jgi:thiopeptide-type bacteriocin biosynthesis protein